MIPNSDAKFEKPTCCCKNDMRNLVNFHASTQKSENWNFDGFLLSKMYYCMSQKITEELCVTTLKNDAEFEEGLICRLKNDMKKLVNFDLDHLRLVSKFAH